MKTKKREIDMLNGSLWNKILIYAIPLAATGILQQLFNAADIAIVGQFTGEKGALAMAAVSANGPIIGLIVNAFIGISLGTNVVIANASGRGDNETVSKAVHTSVLTALIGGIVILIAGEFMARPILSSQNVPGEVLPMAVLYFRIYMLGVPVILLYNFASAIFRAVGNTKTPLIALASSGVLNVLLNLLFVVVLRMTVDGVAIATAISNLVSSSILVGFLIKSKDATKLSLRSLKITWSVLKQILKIGIPAGIQSAVFAFANMIIQSAVNSLGTVVMAASGAAFNIEIFAYYVLNSFSQACTTFTGQNNGAGQPKRCRRVFGLCYLEGVIATALCIALILFFGRNLLSVFNGDPGVIEVGYSRLIVVFSAYTFSLSYEMIAGYLRGFGISATPAVMTIIGICGVRITWIYTVFANMRTFGSIMTVYPVSLGATALMLFISLLIFRPAARQLNGKPLKNMRRH